MKKQRSMGINAVLSGIKTVLSVIFPLITFPYVSNVLSIENYGRYNFSYSIMSYALMFASLGVNTYAIRECSKCRDNRSLLDKTASEIFTINMISTAVAYALLAALLLIPFFAPYRIVIAVLSLNIVFTTIGCEWIYAAYENYLYITVRALITQVVSLALLFIMVRHSEDVVQYALVTMIATSGGNLLYLLGRKQYASIRIVLHGNLKRHLTPIFTIFANTVTTSIYVNSDVIILGILTSDEVVALYSAAAKIYTIVKNVIAAIITVSIPRLSQLWEQRDEKKFSDSCAKVYGVLFTLAPPAMVGLFALSKEFILLLSKPEYLGAVLSLQILSVALLFSVFAWFYKSCILIPTGNEKRILIATVWASVTNIVLNFILIPYMQQTAAALTTLLAELICFFIVHHYGKQYIRISLKLKDVLSVVVGCAAILGVCYSTRLFLTSSLSIFIVSVSASVILYGVCLVIFQNSLLVNGWKLLLRRKKN